MAVEKNKDSRLMLTGEERLEKFYTDVGMLAPSNGEVTVLLNPDTGMVDGVLIARAGVTEKLNLPRGTRH